MEFKGTKGELHAVEYAGIIFIQDSEYYEDSEKYNILDYDRVGKEVADANGKLFSCAPEMLEMLTKIFNSQQVEGNLELWDEIKQLIKKATE